MSEIYYDKDFLIFNVPLFVLLGEPGLSLVIDVLLILFFKSTQHDSVSQNAKLFL